MTILWMQQLKASINLSKLIIETVFKIFVTNNELVKFLEKGTKFVDWIKIPLFSDILIITNSINENFVLFKCNILKAFSKSHTNSNWAMKEDIYCLSV